MNRFFLGRPIHWLILLIPCALGWIAGRMRLHVTDFNLFVVVLILITLAALVAVLCTSGDGRSVTRDRLDDD